MTDSLKILVANGVNLDLLGNREKHHYGRFDLPGLESALQDWAQKLAKPLGVERCDLDFFQSNHEGEFLETITAAEVDGILINPAAWTHTSLALADRLATLNCPYVEVHISNLSAREPLRQKSLSAEHASGVVYGFGLVSYLAGLAGLMAKIKEQP